MTHAATDLTISHPTTSQFQLLRLRRFAPFFWTQFLGVGNDNMFKFAFTILATYHSVKWGNLDPKIAGPLIGGIFILSFVLFSATAGQLADKYDKAMLTRLVKNLEIAFMVVIGAGFAMHIPSLLFIGVFLMGCHSTLFGPVKFACLPQNLHDSELTGGNGMIEMGTFTAILLGSMAGGFLVKLGDAGVIWVALVSMCVAILGRVIAGYIPASPTPVPNLKINWNPLTETWHSLKIAYKIRRFLTPDW